MAHRAGVEIIGGQQGADPAAVVFDAVQAAKARDADILLCDTAGRLHNKKNLMEELKRYIGFWSVNTRRPFWRPWLCWTARQARNALAQAKQFAEVANVTGIILTKLDGTAKGGIAVAIQSELDIPVKYIGVGKRLTIFRSLTLQNSSMRCFIKMMTISGRYSMCRGMCGWRRLC